MTAPCPVSIDDARRAREESKPSLQERTDTVVDELEEFCKRKWGDGGFSYCAEMIALAERIAKGQAPYNRR